MYALGNSVLHLRSWHDEKLWLCCIVETLKRSFGETTCIGRKAWGELEGETVREDAFDV